MISSEKHFWLYVLKLEQGKYYIGITSQTPEKRFREHMGGRKTYWTEKYKPVEILDSRYLGGLTEQEAKLFENRVTREYMKKKGINNVRGGDITDTSSLVIRFGRMYDETSWGALTTVILLLLTIAVLAVKLYTEKK